MKNSKIIWLLRLVPAVILLQTLFFKFTAAPESVYIFSTLGIEPYGRIGSGVFELISAILILWPRHTWLGALLGLGTMMGALFSHIFILGIEVQNDGGWLFFLAVVTSICCVLLLFIFRAQIRENLKVFLKF